MITDRGPTMKINHTVLFLYLTHRYDNYVKGCNYSNTNLSSKKSKPTICPIFPQRSMEEENPERGETVYLFLELFKHAVNGCVNMDLKNAS